VAVLVVAALAWRRPEIRLTRKLPQPSAALVDTNGAAPRAAGDGAAAAQSGASG
jgi:hypothetical protein